MFTPLTPEKFAITIAQAIAYTKRHQCTAYVNVSCRIVDARPIVVSAVVSNWYTDGATVATFTNGERDD